MPVMTEALERRISHKELRIISFRCSNCEGEVRVDLDNETQRERIMHSNSGPLSCQFCKQAFDSNFMKSFEGLRSFFDCLRWCNGEVDFCLRADLDDAVEDQGEPHGSDQ